MDTNVHDELISILIGKTVRVYTTGDEITMDYREDRVNVELSEKGKIVRIWLG